MVTCNNHEFNRLVEGNFESNKEIISLPAELEGLVVKKDSDWYCLTTTKLKDMVHF